MAVRYTKFSFRPAPEGNEMERRRKLGKLLCQAREQAGLTQAAVASALGYKRQYHISQIENANRILDPIELENFARLYRKKLNDFATVDGDQAEISRLLNRMAGGTARPTRRKI
jgi:transcriptional regulator with XRE-family HTH domain